jgi:Ice-binding-like
MLSTPTSGVKKVRRSLVSLGLATVLVLMGTTAALASINPPPLRTAANFGVLAGTTVTNTGPTVVKGELGVAPGSAVTGFPPGVSGTQHLADAVATTAEKNLKTAYVYAAAQSCPAANNYTGVNLGGLTLGPGVYCQTTAPTLTGKLTLNGSGIYIFQIGSTLVTASGAHVVLINGAKPCQIFWQVGSSATIATTTTFVGTIMALASIAMQTKATLRGRALARNGAVTLHTNLIINPGICE